MNPKFIRLIHGPVHFHTRFLPLIKNNKETLHNYVFLVDNAELYEPYKNLTTILNLNEIRESHPFSKELEFIYEEKDPEIYMKNFKSFYTNYYTNLGAFLRFCLPYLYENNILNFTYNNTSVIMTNRQELLNKHFNNKPVGSFIAPLWYDFPHRPHPITDMVKKPLKEKFPNLILPDDMCYFDGHTIGFNFKSKEHLLLFYQIWDYVIYILAKERKDLFEKFLFEGICGYVMRLFELNFSYSYLGIHGEYWDPNFMGTKVFFAHDTLYYQDGRLPDYSFSKATDFNIKNLIKTYKDEFIRYYNGYYYAIDFEITEDNIILTLKYK